MKPILPTSIAILAIILPGVAISQQVKPGSWTWSSKITSVSGKAATTSMVQAIRTDPANSGNQCLSAGEAYQGLARILRNKMGTCAVGRSTVTNGTLDIQAKCTNAGQVTDVHLRGPFTSSAFSLSGTGTSASGVNVSMNFSAKRVGTCG
jgi:hypothetical protein